MNPRAFWIVAVYFGGIGYVVGRRRLDRKAGEIIAGAYDELVAHTKAIPPVITDVKVIRNA